MSETQSGMNGKTPPPIRPGKKRKFTPEYKKSVAARVNAGELAQDVATELGLPRSIVARWAKGEGMGQMGGGGGGGKKWSAAQRKKFKATARAKHKIAAKNTKEVKRPYRRVDENAAGYLLLPIPLKDAISYLKHANVWLYSALQEGTITEFDEAHDYARMALRELLKLKDK